MNSDSDIRTSIDTATVPENATLKRARMIIVDKLSEWASLAVDELVESVCEAYEAPSGEPLRVADVDPNAPDSDSPALRNLRYARAARTAVVDLESAGTIVSVPEHPGDADAVPGFDAVPVKEDGDDGEVATAKETTGRAAEQAGADELILSTGPAPRGLRYALAAT